MYQTATRLGKVTRTQVREIAELKMPDLNAASLEAAERMVAGTARSWASSSRVEGRPPVNRSRRFAELETKVDRNATLPLNDAVARVCELASAKFDESVDASIRLGVDPRHAEQQVRGTVVLPHGTGTSVRVIVFAQGDLAKEAQEAGADLVGGKELADRIKKKDGSNSTQRWLRPT